MAFISSLYMHREEEDFRKSPQIFLTALHSLTTDTPGTTYWLHQHVVLSKQKCGSGVLVKWLNIFPHPHERAIIHATTGLSLLDLKWEITCLISHTEVCRWNHSVETWLSIKIHQVLRCLTRAGLLEGESCRQWPLWMRWRCTSSSAEGSVQKWSAVLTLVYSKAQGPTVATRTVSNADIFLIIHQVNNNLVHKLL